MPTRFRLKPLEEQVVVITGASSGIGLTTARMAARRGARLVLAARSQAALRQLEEEINAAGGQALAVVTDVGNPDDVRHLAEAAVTRFGGFDTWVNDAGISIYGRLTDVPLEDLHRLMQTNLWGVVHGSLEAVRHLRSKGGAIINLGSIVSDRAIPLQGMYSASKHAVKGFTDSLRMELEEAGAPIAVTLVQPSGINTPFPRHAKNYMEREATLPPPVYAPDVVAKTILHCCVHPTRDVVVGGGGKGIVTAGKVAPRLTDLAMEHSMFEMQKKDAPPSRQDALHGPSNDLSERGDYEGMTREHSLYTGAALHPVLTGALIVSVGLAAAALLAGAGED
ncbi:MAG TPA: SDR family oxidoreductase [Tepidisphaeraceae bacterium]|jgi:NAD(P)-dependent dehydrogenase (short-subunit alcohol dehydrogenase family)